MTFRIMLRYYWCGEPGMPAEQAEEAARIFQGPSQCAHLPYVAPMPFDEP
eukprot:CAMPEP_0202421322 /NCGR_PEP_ID=MMETSP1128-20130828/50276_1 /ASSEMBLY_ACC=CAM_ASM_000463 /TAXON_ID=3047 /ORGANISM="Dunaliella tertiolecta, Strain CCMP1320" /LENGTH=49 /DNA_ID=CAMNT_0049029335 /DNA_START=611 /DNA_END=760 /DNA_ORIENTATION=-